ncbi:unnamed protein product [Cuscuta europaea]|uniref:Uncharacterized protein n=1 Tax=Cuscuta europaea TaxID=41803 RepID=A0A9P1E3Z0_CUSEU|nr:unnamed protein product [Cuscuta europaea]
MARFLPLFKTKTDKKGGSGSGKNQHVTSLAYSISSVSALFHRRATLGQLRKSVVATIIEPATCDRGRIVEATGDVAVRQRPDENIWGLLMSIGRVQMKIVKIQVFKEGDEYIGLIQEKCTKVRIFQKSRNGSIFVMVKLKCRKLEIGQGRLGRSIIIIHLENHWFCFDLKSTYVLCAALIKERAEW